MYSCTQLEMHQIYTNDGNYEFVDFKIKIPHIIKLNTFFTWFIITTKNCYLKKKLWIGIIPEIISRLRLCLFHWNWTYYMITKEDIYKPDIEILYLQVWNNPQLRRKDKTGGVCKGRSELCWMVIQTKYRNIIVCQPLTGRLTS